ncbi:MAG: malto-oligosyltrehalose trehalohydrolase [Rhizobiaceae bacterium]|nr:malto-oligosyltrehalose trehalohydrolase [Rhizobiaceae bacterium]MCV0407519.1 malto-oligosyltrehalose trehalohydrolase [Rhizobiaceae bacterium]
MPGKPCRGRAFTCLAGGGSVTDAASTELHLLPRRWGAEFIRDGEARFRLWAPALDQLMLVLDGEASPMARDEDGWFELVADGVRPGARYAFRLPDGSVVPDPASRRQAGSVHGPSLLVDPTTYEWRHPSWKGRPWEETVIYELHVGTFAPEGTFAAAAGRLPYLADLGMSAIELMPVAQFAGDRGWGYDGVLPYAPHPAYGTPDDLKALVDAAHGLGLMVFLDVVYNHFGPEGNYLHTYAPAFFHPERHTPWGPAIAYEREPVRRFFIDNALYWLEEFQFDGLRFDAIDHIRDDQSDPEVMIDIARQIRAELPGRHIHLTTEDNRNVTHLHERDPHGRAGHHTAEWNDDFHNVAHVLLTNEADGYYADFTEDPWGKLGRALAEGFVYQGEHSKETGGPRGVPSNHLPPAAFVDFLQNHDQVGNRALGERLTVLTDPRKLELFEAALLLSPHIPLLFMGEEYGEERPFLFFTDFTGELAKAVRDGRRREFARFAMFRGREEDVPDPNRIDTFNASKLDWGRCETLEGRGRRERLRHLIALRQKNIAPLLASGGRAGKVLAADNGCVAVDWRFPRGRLSMRLNLSESQAAAVAGARETVFADPSSTKNAQTNSTMPPLSIAVTIDRDRGPPAVGSR